MTPLRVKSSSCRQNTFGSKRDFSRHSEHFSLFLFLSYPVAKVSFRMGFQFCLAVVIFSFLASRTFGTAPHRHTHSGPQQPRVRESKHQPSGDFPSFPSSVSSGVPSGVSFSSFKFTNSSNFTGDGKTSSFSSKDFSSKISRVEESGQTLEKNVKTKEFGESQNADASALAEKMQLTKFKNATANIEDMMRMADGTLAQQETKNSGTESSIFDIFTG